MSTLELGQKVLELPREERLDLMVPLQDSLDESDHATPDWHGEILEDRLAKIERGEAKFHTLDEVRASFGLPAINPKST